MGIRRIGARWTTGWTASDRGGSARDARTREILDRGEMELRMRKAVPRRDDISLFARCRWRRKKWRIFDNRGAADTGSAICDDDLGGLPKQYNSRITGLNNDSEDTM